MKKTKLKKITKQMYAAVTFLILVTSSCGALGKTSQPLLAMPPKQSTNEANSGAIGDGLSPTSFNGLRANIFIPRCSACHGDLVSNQNFNSTSYGSVLARVVPNNPSDSLLHQKVVGASHNGITLSVTDGQHIDVWIQDGAPNN